MDCGAYTGDTIEGYVNFSGDNHGKIFAIEADPDNFIKCESFIHQQGYDNVELINCGVWNERGQLSFNSKGDMGSSISKSGDIIVPIDTIDNLVGNEKISLIKMDIEGAELKALQGAAETIKNNKPALAICVYHRRADLITIPQFIKNIHSDYKMYIRKHDMASLYDLVLYAIPE